MGNLSVNDLIEKWDVCMADVPFEDLPQSKVRPVLILGVQEAVLIDCFKMTSHAPREGEYALKEWKAAGLRKETTVRLGKRLVLEQKRIRKKIGRLDKLDILNITKLLK